MYTGFLHLHSSLRYVVLILLLLAVAKSKMGWFFSKDYTNGDKKIAMFAMIFCHIQLLVGLTLYFFLSPVTEVAFSDFGAAMKDSMLRFWAVEHITGMIIAIALITIGYSTAKRATTATVKHKKIALFYGFGFLVMILSIPWPFLKDWGTWF